ncbi:MAG: hypothetical protein RQ761_12910 [Bacteroidales bacterium]|nr:hypothetical protein [Bacteroidales bacterium]
MFPHQDAAVDLVDGLGIAVDEPADDKGGDDADRKPVPVAQEVQQQLFDVDVVLLAGRRLLVLLFGHGVYMRLGLLFG